MAVTGCTAKTQNTTNINYNQKSEFFVEEEDYQYYFDTFSRCAKTENGYIYIKDNLLYFFDINDNANYVICDNINCSHTDDSCSAFLDYAFYTTELFYCNNHLYIAARESKNNIDKNYVYQMNIDGTERKKAAYLFDSNGAVSFQFIIHRGYVYYTYGNGGTKNRTISLYRNKLGEVKNTGEEIYSFSGYGAEIYQIKAFANNLYFEASAFEDENGNGYNTALHTINLNSMEESSLISDLNSYFVYEDNIFYYDDEKKLMCFNIKTKEEAVKLSNSELCYISYDGDYFYLDNYQSIITKDIDTDDRKIKIYDKSWELTDTIVPDNPEDECVFGDNRILVFRNTDQNLMKEKVYAFDKSNKEFVGL